MVNGSAHLSDCVLRCSVITKVATSNTSTCVLRIAAAPDISCIAEVSSFSYNVVVATSRGPCCSGNVGIVGHFNRGLSRRAATLVRTCVSNSLGILNISSSSLPLTAHRGVNEVISCISNEGHCVNCLVSLTDGSCGGLGVKLSYTGNTS